MKKLICVFLSFVLCLSIFTGCTSGNETENSSNADSSYIEDESLLLDANILSGYLSLCLDTKTTPEAPEFNFGHFLVRCAIETQEDFCYYNLFSRASPQSGDYCFGYSVVKKVLKQVFNDDEWTDYWFNEADLSGISHSKEDNTIIMATETGEVWSYHAGEYIYSEFSADGKQVISHIELFAPDASSGDPGSKSIGNYNIVFDICSEDNETFLRFNRFEKSDNDNTVNTEQTDGDISFDNSEVIADIKSVYSSAPYNGVEEIELLQHSKGDYSFRAWRVFDETDEDIYWLICRFKNDRLIGFLKGEFTGLKDFYSYRINDFYSDRSEEDFEFFTSDDLSLVKIRSAGHSSVFSFEFYHNGMTIQDYANASQAYEPDEYVKAEIQDFYNTVKVVTGDINETDRKKYEDLICSYINDGTIELDPEYSNNKKYKNYYSADVINYYEDDSTLLINYIMRCSETSLGLVQTTLFEKDGSNLVYSGSSRIFNYCYSQNKDKTLEFYSGGRFSRGFEQEVFLYNAETKQSQNLGLVHNTGNTFDVGFMSNGDGYIMNYEEFRTYNIKDNAAVQSFTTKTNFPAGSVIKADGTKRYLLAIRRDPDNFDYIAVYGEYIEDDDYYVAHPNDLQLAYNYKIGLLDKNGSLTKSWDTGVPIMFNAFGFEEVSMYKSGENEIEFFASTKGYESIRGKFNITTGVYTPVKEFKLP